jgi:hypothetical protein
VGLVPPGAPVLAADPAPADANPLETPMGDLAVLPPAGGGSQDSTPDLLVLEASPADQAAARLAVLRRTDAWERIALTELALHRDGLDDRWLIGLDDRRFVLVATSSSSTPGTGLTVLVTFDVREDSGRPAVVEVDRMVYDFAVEHAAPVDVDASGTSEIVLGLRPSFDSSGSCGRSPIYVLDSVTLGVRRGIELPGRIGAGAIGRWDDTPGEDLLAFASPDCPPGGSGGARLMVVGLRDGTESTLAAMAQDVDSYPAPLRVRLDDGLRDRAIVWTSAGLALVDGVGGGLDLVAQGRLLPLVAAPDGADRQAIHMAWIDDTGLHAQVVGPGGDGMEVRTRTDLSIAEPDAERWELLYQATVNDIGRQGLPSAWLGDVTEPGCPDLILPGAIMPCGAAELRPGAAWTATRPIAAMPLEGRRGLIVAAGLGWDPRIGTPATPSPWVAGPEGRWRAGPSTPFALSEIRATDVAYFAEFPVPTATIDRTATGEGSTLLPGFTGTRLFVSVTPLAEDEEGPDVAPSRLAGFSEGPGRDGMIGTVRVPVPPGNESGRDGSFTSLPLSGVRSGNEPSKRWSVRVLPINDWGEVGFPVVGTVARDAVAPTLDMEIPFTTSVWPYLARIPGRAEPGSTITLEGVGEMPIDDRGRFHVETRLAPWPQTLRLTATDAAGNASTAEFSVIGGVDYRRFPWALIVALSLLAVVAVRGLAAAGRRAGAVEASPWSLGTMDDAARPEIEELPPGAGLSSR